jgi:hypothetical protein
MTVPTTVTFGELGPLVTSVDVDNLILGLLKPWIPFHQRWLESERGLAPGFLADPRTYSSVLDDVEFPDAALPALYVTAAETIGRPAMDLEHRWNNAWRVRVSCVTRGQNGTHTRLLAAYMEGCVRRILLAPQDAFDGEIRWLSTNVAPVSDRSGAGRYLSAGIADYAVYADHAVGCDIPTATLPTGSPYPPPTDPYAPLEPLVPVSTVTTEVRPK